MDHNQYIVNGRQSSEDLIVRILEECEQGKSMDHACIPPDRLNARSHFVSQSQLQPRGNLIGLLAKGDIQVILYSMVAMFIFSGLGGAWFQLEPTGGVLATIGRVLPSAWAMTGLQNILIRGLGLSSIWQPVGILTGYAIGFFVLAVWQFRKMEM